MTSLVINLDKKEDIKLFEELATRFGWNFSKLSEEDKRMLARKELVEQLKPSINLAIPDELILDLIEADRIERYGQN